MADAPLPTNLNRARESKIEELSRHFANDDLSLEDLERRIESVYKAANVADLEAITADLRLAVAANPSDNSPIREADPLHAGMPAPIELPRSRMLAIMSSTKRVGRWTVPRDLSVFAMMSDTKIDLTRASLPAGGIVNLDMTTVMASFKVIVPPGMRVVNDLHSIMSDVGSAAEDPLPGELTSARVPVLRLTGTAFMSEVKIKVRRREEPLYEED
jgi:hypothetical protein